MFILNHGTVGYNVQVDVDPYDPILKIFRRDKSADFRKKLRIIGFQIQYKPYVPAHGKSVLKVKFQPQSELEHLIFQMRIMQSSTEKTITVMGSSSTPVLELLSESREMFRDYVGDYKHEITSGIDSISMLDFGTCSLNRNSTKRILLANRGILPTDFYMQRGLPSEISIEPFCGVVLPGEEKVLTVNFCPKVSGEVDCKIKILHNGSNNLGLCVKGKGGAAFLEAGFFTKHDSLIKGLDFELVPTRVKAYRYFVIYNRGIVESDLKINTNSPHYTVEVMGHPIVLQTLTALTLDSLKNASSINFNEVKVLWKSLENSSSATEDSLNLISTVRTKPYQRSLASPVRSQNVLLPAGHCTLCSVALVAAKPKIYSGILHVESDFNSLQLVLKGRGGTVTMKHTGDLIFKKVACNRLFTKKITIENGGSIPVKIRLYWKLYVSCRCTNLLEL